MQISKHIYRLRKIIACLLLALITSLLLNNVAYLHTHVTDGGEVITHAHPYNSTNDSTPVKTHTHKKYEYSVIHSILFFVVASTLVLAVITAKHLKAHITNEIYHPFCKSISNLLRGPPSSVIY